MAEKLFDATLLKDLDLPFSNVTFPGGPEGSSGIVVRPMQRDDFEKGFVPLLSQLTSVGDMKLEDFQRRFDEMKARDDTYYTVVFEDTTTGQLCGSGSLVVERKFIHNCAKRGHIEDIVIDETRRGQQLGKIMIETLKALAKRVGCYKVTLDCKVDRVGFYHKCGFQNENMAFMFLRLNETK
eukprot:Colp12_sorted_trinity150504_noHs@19712